MPRRPGLQTCGIYIIVMHILYILYGESPLLNYYGAILLYNNVFTDFWKCKTYLP